MSMKVMQYEMRILRGRMDLGPLASYRFTRSKKADLLVQKTYRSIIHGSLKLKVHDARFTANSFEQFCEAINKTERHRTLDMNRVSVETLSQGEMVSKVIKTLSNHFYITHFLLTNSKISDEDVPLIKEGVQKENLQLLSSISLADNEICGQQAYNLAKTISKTNLTLDLSRNYIDDDGVKRIQQLKNPKIILTGNPDGIYSNNHDLKRAV